MFAALDGSSQCLDRLWVLEKVTQRARRAGGFHAADTARVADAGEDVSVRLEGREQTFGLLGYQLLRSHPQLVELRTDLVRYDFGQLVDVFLLKPPVGVTETAADVGELASTQRQV